MIVPVELPEEVIEEILQRVLARLQSGGSPWLTRAQAADYLGMPLSRLEKDRRIPSHRDGGRVFYDRRELDEYMRSLPPCGVR